jgi:catechol 2,3-dioxygenase-like lactoylglutathione lyase family enzyme
MITGGNASVFVSDMDRAVEFYVDTLGLGIDKPIADVVDRLTEKGERFRGPIVNDTQAGIALAFFGDQDGNDRYLCQVLRQWSI